MSLNEDKLKESFDELYIGDYNIPCIDQLRQWLNERDKSKLVTTKDLEHWLKPLIENQK